MIFVYQHLFFVHYQQIDPQNTLAIDWFNVGFYQQNPRADIINGSLRACSILYTYTKDYSYFKMFDLPRLEKTAIKFLFCCTYNHFNLLLTNLNALIIFFLCFKKVYDFYNRFVINFLNLVSDFYKFTDIRTINIQTLPMRGARWKKLIIKICVF